MQIGTKMVIDRTKRVVELRADLLIPGYYSNSKRKGQVPCEVSHVRDRCYVRYVGYGTGAL